MKVSSRMVVCAAIVAAFGGGPAPGAIAADPIVCEGDACQPLPPLPEDQTVTTLIPGPGNPKVRYWKTGGHGRKHGPAKKPHRHGSRGTRVRR